jgi:hypothetical protein
VRRRTSFASSYDTDDVAYRLLTMVQMTSVLVLAAGVPPRQVVTTVPSRLAISSCGLGSSRSGCGQRSRTWRAGGPRCVTPQAFPYCRWGGWCASSSSGRRPPSSCWPSWSSRCRGGRNGPGPPAGIRTTSPSGTGCSRSSCSARAFCRDHGRAGRARGRRDQLVVGASHPSRRDSVVCHRRPAAATRRAAVRRGRRGRGNRGRLRPADRFHHRTEVLPCRETELTNRGSIVDTSGAHAIDTVDDLRRHPVLRRVGVRQAEPARQLGDGQLARQLQQGERVALASATIRSRMCWSRLGWVVESSRA